MLIDCSLLFRVRVDCAKKLNVVDIKQLNVVDIKPIQCWLALGTPASAGDAQN